MANIHKIFIGSGGDDWFTQIVESYEAQYARLNPTYLCRYFSWTEQAAVGDLLLSVPRDHNVTVVGHSYGADAAFSALGRGRRVNVLISIDPVGRIRPSWAAIRSAANVWLNVRAEPTRERRTRDDTIAAIGGKYPRPPEPGRAGAPNHVLIANESHGAFRAMMRLMDHGVSGASLLGGRRVA